MQHSMTRDDLEMKTQGHEQSSHYLLKIYSAKSIHYIFIALTKCLMNLWCHRLKVLSNGTI